MSHRTLDIFEPDSASGRPTAAALLADLVNADSDVLVFGGTSAERMLREVGLESEDRLPRLAGRVRPMLATGPLRRYLAESGPFDLLQVWSPGLLALTMAVAPQTPKLVMLTVPPATDAAGRWLRSMLGTPPSRHPVRCVAASETVAAAWCAVGVPPDVVDVVPPGVRFGRLAHADRGPIRAALGIASAPDRTPADRGLVVAVPAPPDGRPIDAARLGRLLALCRLNGLDVHFVCPPRTWRRSLGYSLSEEGTISIRGSSRRTSRPPRRLDEWPEGPEGPRKTHTTDQSARLVVDDRLDRPWTVYPACDAVLILGDDRPLLTPDAGRARAVTRSGRRTWWKWANPLAAGSPQQATAPDVLALCWAMASGRAIVAEATHTATAWLEPDVTGLFVPPGDDNSIVERFHRLVSTADLAWRLGEASRAVAYREFSRQRWSSQVREIQRQVVERSRSTTGECAIIRTPASEPSAP